MRFRSRDRSRRSEDVMRARFRSSPSSSSSRPSGPSSCLSSSAPSERFTPTPLARGESSKESSCRLDMRKSAGAGRPPAAAVRRSQSRDVTDDATVPIQDATFVASGRRPDEEENMPSDGARVAGDVNMDFDACSAADPGVSGSPT